MPRKSGSDSGRFYVGDDKRTFTSEYAAIALAQTICQRKPKLDTTNVYVRELGTQGAIARVYREGTSVITQRIR